MMDLLINILCIVVSVYLCCFVFDEKLKLGSNLPASLGLVIFFSLLTVCAKYFHVAWMLWPVDGGIPWQDYPLLFWATVLWGVVSLFLFIVRLCRKR